MDLDSRLVQAAIDFVKNRYGSRAWAGAAAMYTSDGQVLISTGPDVVSASVELCHEVGAICESFKLDKKVTATVCVSQDDKGGFHILTPCGVCQERLYVFGPDVQAAVPVEGDSTKWQMKTLSELQPYYWRKPFLTNVGIGIGTGTANDTGTDPDTRISTGIGIGIDPDNGTATGTGTGNDNGNG